MKHDQQEIFAVIEVATVANESFEALTELQLALVGGGVGEVVVA
ncbi:MAG TPA: hypothetical protein VEC19_17385 [Usitatibacter sp.]|nr:hypothetical protein [Usitatibacter sp.]